MSGKFYDDLNITKLYCETQLKNTQKTTASILRSINLIYNKKELFEFKYTSYPITEWTVDPLDEQANIAISDLFTEQMSVKYKTISGLENADNIKGRILIADFDETVVDGASEAESEGFIDGYDLPPIDTWFYLSRRPNGWRYMYAWAPDKFIDLVENAILVNCVDCLRWYDETGF